MHASESTLYIKPWHVVIAWLVALAASMPSISSEGLMTLPLFPIGILLLFKPKIDVTFPMIAILWLHYLAITAATLLTEKRRPKTIIFSILVILLLLNIAGCRQTWSAVSRI